MACAGTARRTVSRAWLSLGVTMRAKISMAMLVASLVLLLPVSSAAQQMTEINGRVVDPEGLGIPGATVTATNVGTGMVRTVSTGANGAYVINLLPPGSYNVFAEMDGFSRMTRNDLRLEAGQQASFDWQLKLGGVEQTVTVKGEAPLVDRSSN